MAFSRRLCIMREQRRQREMKRKRRKVKRHQTDKQLPEGTAGCPAMLFLGS